MLGAVVVLAVCLAGIRPLNGADAKPSSQEMDTLTRVDKRTVLKSSGAKLIPFLELARHQYSMKSDGESMGVVVPTLSKYDLMQVVEYAVADSRKWPTKNDRDSYRFYTLDSLIRTAIEQAGEEDLARVARIVTSARRDHFTWTPLFEQLMARLVKREIGAVAKEVKALVPLPMKAELPDAVAGARPDFRAAWQQYMGVSELVRSLEQRADGRWIAYSSDPSGFYAVLDRVLAGKSDGVMTELALYRRDRGCLDMGELSSPLASARWLTLLRERRLAEAIGASFATDLRDREVAAIRRALFSACQLDGAQIVLGRLLVRGAGDEWRGREAYSTGGAEPGADLEIFARGPERDTRWVLDLAELVATAQRHPPDGPHSELYSYIGAFAIIAARAKDGDAPLPEALRAEAAAQFSPYLDASQPDVVLQTAIEEAGRVRSNAAKEPLRALLTHWSPAIATKAAESLNALGERVEPPTAPEPAHFRLRVKGQPLANRAACVSVSGIMPTDKRGTVPIRREVFHDPRERITEVHFTSTENDPFHFEIRGVPALFSVAVPVPSNLDVETTVEIATQRLTLTISANRPAAFYKGRRMSIRIARLDAEEEEKKAGYKVSGYWTPPVGKEFVADLQSGSYSAEVFVAGAAKWKLGRFDVGREPVTLPVKLAAATELEFQIVSPDGKPLANPYDFTRDGVRFQPEQEWAGSVLVPRAFPAGHYVMRVLSTKKWKERWYREEGELPPREPKYQGREVRFEIPSDLPPVVKIGRITLPRAAD